jgi:thiol-disulfide isomerase/thioredoxin
MTTPRRRKQNLLGMILLPIFTVLILILGGLWFIKTHFDANDRPTSKIAIQVGSTLPDFSLTRLDGSQTLASEIQARVILINFWASWCEACLQEMPSLVQVHQQFRARGLEILGVNLDDTPLQTVPKIIQQYEMKFPVFIDPRGVLGDFFDIHAIPLTVVIDKDRKILYIENGEYNWNSADFQTQLKAWLKK